MLVACEALSQSAQPAFEAARIKPPDGHGDENIPLLLHEKPFDVVILSCGRR